MRVISYFLAFLAGGGALYAAMHEINGPSQWRSGALVASVDLSYTDFVTVMFSGATLVLAAVALIVGLVAIFTYTGIKDEARRTIHAAVDRQMDALDERIEREVGEEAEEKITRAIERAGRNGALDRALERALMAIEQGGTKLSGELEQNDVAGDDDEER